MYSSDRVQLFNCIRDIPYSIGLTMNAPDYGCGTKSAMLGQLLGGLGLETRLRICTFAWEETPLPPKVLEVPHTLEAFHQFLQLFVPESNTWRTVDPTWDAPLGRAGFTVAEWDGLHDTPMAITPHKIYNPRESQTFLQTTWNETFAEKWIAEHHNFYKAVNEFLGNARMAVSMLPAAHLK